MNEWPPSLPFVMLVADRGYFSALVFTLIIGVCDW